MAVVALATPKMISDALATGHRDNLIYDYQPLGPVGAIWSDDAPMPIGWDRAFAATAQVQLACGAQDGRVPKVVEVPAASGDGAKCIAFHVETDAGAGFADGVYDLAGNLTCLILGNCA
jgi:hypothetical protein